MTFLSRWRKRSYNNVITIGPDLIRELISDDVDFPINALLYDYIHSVSDDDLNRLGEAIATDDELWMCLADVVISYAVSMRFTELIEEAGIEPE